MTRLEDASTEVVKKPPVPYTISEAVQELFITTDRFSRIVDLLRRKGNVILQGPPGVGKTFFCKRVAYALMGEQAADRVGMVQFHQTYSYEDFVEGFRPSGGGFVLRSGIFQRFCAKATGDPDQIYVFIIDEVNLNRPGFGGGCWG